MAKPIRRQLAACLAALALGAATEAYGLASDREQPIKLSADRVDMNQKTGLSKYVGNVVLVQGSLRIEADEVTVRFSGSEIDTVSGKGKPVTFRQRVDNQEEEVFGSALRLQYRAADNRLELYDQVTFRQGEDVFRTPVLRYDLASSKLTALGKSEDRVHSVIQPRKTGEDKGNP